LTPAAVQPTVTQTAPRETIAPQPAALASVRESAFAQPAAPVAQTRAPEPVEPEPSYVAEAESYADTSEQDYDQHEGHYGEQAEEQYQPAAAAAAAAPAFTPAQQPAPVAQHVQPAPVSATPRLPTIEDFPPHAQRQYHQRNAAAEEASNPVTTKRKSLFQRLASVGLGRRDEELDSTPKSEPVMSSRHETRNAPEPQGRSAAETSPSGDLDDDQLEIPAFLRRQAN